MTALWRSLLSASLDSNSHLKHASYFQLATVKPDGRPANRTVVFRGFVEGTDKLQVTTDSRTHKIEEISHCPYGELREKVWFASSLRSRLQYLGPHPHIALSNTEDVENSLDPCTGPVGTFCLLTLDPDQVDYLNLKSNQRIVFKRLGGDVDGNCQWMQQEVNP